MGAAAERTGFEDAALVRAALAGSETAYAELVHRYQDLLFRHAERMTGRTDDAEDIVQRAFIRAYRSLGSCRDPGRVGPWLFRINANLCKDWLKSRHRQGVSLEDAGPIATDAGDPEDGLRRRELGARIEAALGAIPEEQREAFLLKHLEGWSYEEMTEALEVSIPALKMRVHRARETLRRRLAAPDRGEGE